MGMTPNIPQTTQNKGVTGFGLNMNDFEVSVIHGIYVLAGVAASSVINYLLQQSVHWNFGVYTYAFLPAITVVLSLIKNYVDGKFPKS